MRSKAYLFAVPGVLSIYILTVLTGNALLDHAIDPAIQIIFLDLAAIAFSFIAFIYLVWGLANILSKSIFPGHEKESSSLLNRLRVNLRKDYSGVFGVLSGFAVFVTFEFIIYSGLIGHLWDIYRFWRHIYSGIG